MKQKLKLITKESIDEEKNIKSINERIEQLKKEFRKRTYQRIGELYYILEEIVRLKRSTNKKYRPRSLEWEKGINLSAMQIRYIFAYRFISSYSKDMVKKGLIEDSSICHFLAISKILREREWQNRLVDKVIAGEIKVSQVSELKENEIKDFLLGKLNLRKDDAYLFTATKTLRSIKGRLKEREHLIKDSPFSRGLFNAIRDLNELVGEKVI